MCKHERYQVKQIMDFFFCICDDCNLQWRGTEPFQEINQIYNEKQKESNERQDKKSY